jgi:D-glycero-alpha-D-manno-heptose-7-phosphate kinase
MLLVRAPVRISFAGGGTDLPSYYEHYGGLVVSTTIDKYFYVFLNPHSSGGVHITSSDYRRFDRVSENGPADWDGDLRLPRAVLHDFGLNDGFSIFLASEIPPGTGLGSSSTVAVTLCKAISTYLGLRLSPQEIAERAAAIEIEKLGSPIGRQDQYAAAFGGFNVLEFTAFGVTARPLDISRDVRRRLEGNLLLFYTGASRSANSILEGQRTAARKGDATVVEGLHTIKGLAEETRTALERGDLADVAELLDEGWQAKRRLASGVTNQRIDMLYGLARKHGALGGKLLGAGGGGFLLLYAEDDRRDAVCAAMAGEGLHRVDFHFEDGGAKVLLNSLASAPAMTASSLAKAA